MKRNSKEKDKILRRAFWSGEMEYKRWQRIMRGNLHGHRKVFYQSFLHLPISWLLHETGVKRFINIWPEIRDEFMDDSPSDRIARDGWDAVWGMATVGDSQYPVTLDTAELPRKRREVMRLVVTKPGISAYEIAKATGRNYSRVYKDIQLLVGKHMIISIKKEDSARRERHLIPARSVNAHLAGF